MGKYHAKICVLSLLVTRVLFLSSLLFGEEGGTSTTLTNFALPEFSQDTGKLQFILYGDKAEAVGPIIKLSNVLVDLVKEDIQQVNDVTDFSKLKVYKIDEKTPQIIVFWNSKPHCKAIIQTSQAVYDRTTKTANGKEKIFFRSPFMDIDGVGFDTDYVNQIIHVRNKVKVVIRQSISKATNQQEDRTPKSGGGKIETGK